MEIAVHGMPTLYQVVEFDRFIDIQKQPHDLQYIHFWIASYLMSIWKAKYLKMDLDTNEQINVTKPLINIIIAQKTFFFFFMP